MDTGLIHIYCGDGKGKTTAALGLAIRCAGRGGRIIFAQFLKNRDTGELYSLAKFDNIKIIRSTGLMKFTFQMTASELAKTRDAQIQLFHRIAEQCHIDQPDMIVLDEIIGTIGLGLLPEHEVISFLQNKPRNLEVIMTGRNPSQPLIDTADYVSEIIKRKHPFDRGIGARIGIEE
ncbi:MAG: cob(I)yrinic acid a,c-diamide adenosyltransferase [Megasphaera sp.]|jgi:cob(I)alamin adenosyltransferase|nr:cob(I)yrinic acid a,c-diamide adenosyltransferase [Megasphaera sp.]MCI1248553.1 cob(I)yrinic acid a,c-diamide adenosyltransferase [Megasphaera sp.]